MRLIPSLAIMGKAKSAPRLARKSAPRISSASTVRGGSATSKASLTSSCVFEGNASNRVKERNCRAGWYESAVPFCSQSDMLGQGVLVKNYMNESDRRFWPFKPRLSTIASLAVLIGLLLILVILRTKLGLPSEKSGSAVLIGVLLFSVLPIVLALLDMIIERGGVIAYAGVKIDFSGVRQVGMSGITVPANVGVRG